MTKQVVSSAKEGSVLVIRLCSLENRNSMTMEMREQLGEAVEIAESDRAVRVGVSDCRGADLLLGRRL